MNFAKKDTFYRAFISHSKEQPPFDFSDSKTRNGAVLAIKRRNTSIWRFCFIWSICIKRNRKLVRSIEIHPYNKKNRKER